jgi:hypothetical protein
MLIAGQRPMERYEFKSSWHVLRLCNKLFILSIRDKMEMLFRENGRGRVQGYMGKQCIFMRAKAESALEKMS